jgi:hypothetical protein
LAALLIAVQVPAQSRKDLEQKRDALDKQILTTSSLSSRHGKEQKGAQQQVKLLEAQIGQRRSSSTP